MKSVIQEVSRDVVKHHPIIHKIRYEQVWESLYEPLIRIDTVKNAVRNPIRVKSTSEYDPNS